MALKAVIETKDEIPEGFEDHYKEVDGVYALQLEEWRKHPELVHIKEQADSNRNKLKSVSQERDQLKEKLENIPEDFDPDEYERLKANGGGDQDLQKKIDEARERERKRHETTINNLTGERDDLKQKLNKNVVENQLKTELGQLNIVPTMRTATERLWRNDLTIDEDGNPVTTDGKPLSDAIKEWAESEEGKHFIAAPANGGGSGGGGQGGSNTKDNPFTKEAWNLTEQMRLQNQEPDKAKRLETEAGGK